MFSTKSVAVRSFMRSNMGGFIVQYKIHVNIVSDQLSCLQQRATDQQINKQ